MADEELNFELGIVPSHATQAFHAELEKLGKDMDAITAKNEQGILSGFKAQVSELAKIRQLMNPDLISKQVSLDQERVKLNKELSELTKLERESQQGMTDAAKEHLDTVKKIKEAMDPEALKRQVERDIELEKVRSEYADKAKAEHDRQAGTGQAQNASTSMHGMLESLAAGASQGQGFGAELGKLGSALLAARKPGADLTPTAEGTMGSVGRLATSSPDQQLGAAGGAIGMAIGGPAGAAVGEAAGAAVTAGLKKAGEFIAAPADMAVNGLKGLDSALRELNSILGPIGIGFNALTFGMQKFADNVKAMAGPIASIVLGPLLDSLTMVPEVLKGITETLVGFAAKASPGAFQQYALALEDVQGVIGGTFLPVLELMTNSIRLFGDVLADLLPNSDEVSHALRGAFDAFDDFRKALQELTKELGPIIRAEVVSGLQALSWALKSVASSVSSVMRTLTPWIAQLRQLFGLMGGENRSSFGASAQPARFTGIEEYERQLQESALSSGASAVDMPTMVSDISTTLTNIWRWLENVMQGFMNGFFTGIFDAIRRAFPQTGPMLDGAWQGAQAGAGAGIGIGMAGYAGS